MNYNDCVLEHFTHPLNIGEIPNADGISSMGSEECGDIIKVWIKVADEHLVDIKYKIFGCPAAIACCSMMTQLAMGMHVDEAWELTDEQVAEALGGLPEPKYHCSNLAASALHKAIMNYVFGEHRSNTMITMTILVDNMAENEFQSEHGWSLWMDYGGSRVLFDLGQTDLILKNAKLLGVDLGDAEAIVLSHGHYDHTGGLSAVLDIAEKATVYFHPDAVGPKYGRKDAKTRWLGVSESTGRAIGRMRDSKRVISTQTPTEITNGLFATGEVPRITDFEDVGGAFFADEACQTPDMLRDDQSLFFDTPKGLVILPGCAHSGIVNTMAYVAKLTGKDRIYAVIGGMHLVNASDERIERTLEAFGQYDVQRIGLAHCTGPNAIKKFKAAFSDRCFVCSVGMRIEFPAFVEPPLPEAK